MKAVPISPPNNRLILEQASDGEGVGRMDRLDDQHDQREGLADCPKDLRRQKVIRRPLARQIS
jgi:hypothetical protein